MTRRAAHCLVDIIIPGTNGDSLKSNFLNGLHLSSVQLRYDGRATRNWLHFLPGPFTNQIYFQTKGQANHQTLHITLHSLQQDSSHQLDSSTTAWCYQVLSRWLSVITLSRHYASPRHLRSVSLSPPIMARGWTPDKMSGGRLICCLLNISDLGTEHVISEGLLLTC